MSEPAPTGLGWVPRGTLWFVGWRGKVAAGLFGTGTALRFTPDAPHAAVPIALGYASAVAMLLYCGRLVIRLLARYVCRHPGRLPDRRRARLRKQLNFLLGVDVALIIGWAGESFMLLAKPVSLITAPLAFVLWLLLARLAGRTARLAHGCGLPSGSEWLFRRIRPWRRDLKSAAAVAHTQHMVSMFGDRTPPRQASAFVAVVLGVLWAAWLANLAPASVQAANLTSKASVFVWQLMSGPEAKKNNLRNAHAPGVGHDQHPTTSPSNRGGGPNASSKTGSSGGTEPPPTYDSLCGTAFKPGDPAPEPQREGIHDVFVQAGAIEAACAQEARQVRGEPAVWYAPAYCQGELRSVAVADDDGVSLVYEGAARLALRLAVYGQLTDASPREQLLNGDGYVLDSAAGAYAVVRSVESLGRLRRAVRRSCADTITRNAPYTIVPPALISGWIGLIHEYGWVWPDKEAGSAPYSADGGFVFHPNSNPRVVVASASCTDARHCTMVIEGQTTTYVGGTFVTIQQLQDLAYTTG